MLIQVSLELLGRGATVVGRDVLEVGDMRYRVVDWSVENRALMLRPLPEPAANE